MEHLIPISPGELLDRLSILKIKVERIADSRALANVRHELRILTKAGDTLLHAHPELNELGEQLYRVNSTLWSIEDRLREHERHQLFDATFVELARLVYQTNDLRAEVKRSINSLLGSTIREEKLYERYR